MKNTILRGASSPPPPPLLLARGSYLCGSSIIISFSLPANNPPNTQSLFTFTLLLSTLIFSSFLQDYNYAGSLSSRSICNRVFEFNLFDPGHQASNYLLLLLFPCLYLSHTFLRGLSERIHECLGHGYIIYTQQQQQQQKPAFVFISQSVRESLSHGGITRASQRGPSAFTFFLLRVLSTLPPTLLDSPTQSRVGALFRSVELRGLFDFTCLLFSPPPRCYINRLTKLRRSAITNALIKAN